MLVSILGTEGGLSNIVNTLPITTNVVTPGSLKDTCIIVFELETEPEKNQEALRKVKDKIRFDKFLKSVGHSLPL
jgi:hypothetical protein